MSDVKFPRRSLIEAVRKAASKTSLLNTGGGSIPPLVVEVVKASLHNGKLEDDSQSQLAALAAEAAAAGAIAVGTNADTGTFRGQFEDLEVVRSAVQTPVICNDFVVYGYQIFRAKACGADVVRLMASVLPVQDIEYMIKTAKALGMMCMVVVSSKQQLLDVLKGVPTLQALSVTSRNMRLWKVS
jgi:indole-3-glycerol phosphate synthase